LSGLTQMHLLNTSNSPAIYSKSKSMNLKKIMTLV